LAWLESILGAAEARAEGPGSSEDELGSAQLDVQGVHCAGCVWLLNETFRRRPGAVAITVNPTLGQVQLSWRRRQFDVAGWVRAVEAFGYQFGPARKRTSRRGADLTLRLGICAALAVNGMLFSISFYFGLLPDAEGVFRLFTWLSFALASAIVVIGGWPFFRTASASVRSGVLHLDVPIALGILLVYGSSILQMRSARGDIAYFDTLNTFIVLMLVGRWLQERVLERNRRFLLEDDGAEGLTARRIAGAGLETIPVAAIREGDRLLVAPGDLVPVDARLLDERAVVSTDWITGEATPRQIAAGERIGAGAFNAGRSAVALEAASDFADSPLIRLLRQPPPRPASRTERGSLWGRLARTWVVVVLALATTGFLVWLPRGFDAALNVAVALLVVTCPCAIGIAIPLAYELVLARLRRGGFFVRDADLLDRLLHVRKVLFDKTGTLTLGRLELADPGALAGLSETARDVAYNLAVRSVHPVSVCLASALARAACYDAAARVEEVAGQGVEWRRADGRWRLGRADWAVELATAAGGEPLDGVDGATPADWVGSLAPAAGLAAGAVLGRDGVAVARLELREILKADARRQVQDLVATGREVWLLSGDEPTRLAVVARSLGVPPERALGGLTPEQKAAAVERIDRRDTLYLGDGVNDSLAFERAYAAGTPAIDRPVLPGKSDFFLVGEGLGPVAQALAAARELRGVVGLLVALSWTYNVAVVALALAGKMAPVLAAVLMPASTLTLLALTAARLGRSRPRAAASARRPAWPAAEFARVPR
jgi:Cu2+-exporting ATPase